MRILFTGASSFTGSWFVGALARRGHEVVATFRRPADGYDGVRARRVALAREAADARFGVSFGDDAFLAMLSDEEPFDVLCHHAAEVSDYKSADFDPAAALAANTRNLAMVARALGGRGGTGIVLTGSVFEQDEGAGERPLRAFSPYGLSKGLTAASVGFFAGREGLAFGKFVIANPFGPYEEPRFTTYLAKTWLEGGVPTVSTPAYVRDNIHVSLLAAEYARFVEALPAGPRGSRVAPTGYVESQGAFARRFAAALEPRLGVRCRVELADQRDFPEPRIRINTDPADGADWSEATAWDELAAYYREAYA